MHSFRSVRFITIPETGSICREHKREISSLATWLYYQGCSEPAQIRLWISVHSEHLSHKKNVFPPSHTEFQLVWCSQRLIEHANNSRASTLSPGRKNSLKHSVFKQQSGLDTSRKIRIKLLGWTIRDKIETSLSSGHPPIWRRHSSQYSGNVDGSRFKMLVMDLNRNLLSYELLILKKPFGKHQNQSAAWTTGSAEHTERWRDEGWKPTAKAEFPFRFAAKYFDKRADNQLLEVLRLHVAQRSSKGAPQTWPEPIHGATKLWQTGVCPEDHYKPWTSL